MSKSEKEIDNFIASTLQKKRIDFMRINNSNSRGKISSYNTTAYETIFSCAKYWPDFMFAYNKKVYMFENGLRVGNKLSNQDRKDKQMDRLKYWEKNGNCNIAIILSVEAAKEYFKKIKLLGN